MPCLVSRSKVSYSIIARHILIILLDKHLSFENATDKNYLDCVERRERIGRQVFRQLLWEMSVANDGKHDRATTVKCEHTDSCHHTDTPVFELGFSEKGKIVVIGKVKRVEEYWFLGEKGECWATPNLFRQFDRRGASKSTHEGIGGIEREQNEGKGCERRPARCHHRGSLDFGCRAQNESARARQRQLIVDSCVFQLGLRDHPGKASHKNPTLVAGVIHRPFTLYLQVRRTHQGPLQAPGDPAPCLNHLYRSMKRNLRGS